MQLKCNRCGKCCTNPTGLRYLDIELFKEDCDKGIPPQMYELRIGGPDDKLIFWMKRKPNGECIAYRHDIPGCSIYNIRPKECRDFTPEHQICRRFNAN